MPPHHHQPCRRQHPGRPLRPRYPAHTRGDRRPAGPRPQDDQDRTDGRWPNAVQDETGRKTWRVPVTDLVTANDLAPDQVAHVENELAARREHRETKALREQTIRLQEQLAAAQALADERAATITFLKGLLRKGGAA